LGLPPSGNYRYWFGVGFSFPFDVADPGDLACGALPQNRSTQESNAPVTINNTVFASGQIRGARDYQEDQIRVAGFRDADRADDSLLLIVADGMGGHIAGAEASSRATRNFVTAFASAAGPLPQRLLRALTRANEAISETIHDNPGLRDMGTTLLAATVSHRCLYWISVGDSPLWLCRDGELIRLNADHSMRPVLRDLVEIGRMTSKEAARDPRANQLRSAVCGEDLPLIDHKTDCYPLVAGDSIILASDGVESLDTDEIARIITSADGAEIALKRLLEAVEHRDAFEQDNASAIIYVHPDDPERSLSELISTMEAPAAPSHSKPATNNDDRDTVVRRKGVLGRLLNR
jgi:protein phosphatase